MKKVTGFGFSRDFSMHERKWEVTKEGVCLQALVISFWKLVRSWFFVQERTEEAGSNLSRWQRKQVIWKKNLSYSDEWGRQSRGRDSCSLLELLFNFFLRLGVKWRGDPRGFADDHFLAGKGPSYSSLLPNSALQQSPEQCEGWSVRFRLVRIMFRDSNIRFV